MFAAAYEREHTEVDGLLETRRCEQACGVADTAGRGDDLSSSTVDSIGVQLRATRLVSILDLRTL